MLYIASPQQGDLRLSGPPSGYCAGSGARTRDRRVPADLKVDSLATVPLTPPEESGGGGGKRRTRRRSRKEEEEERGGGGLGGRRACRKEILSSVFCRLRLLSRIN
ncbi:hypothetical protein PoB_007343900 [Plakobranchus ocellatus]|uniref:Uncharacterized protein n=1 Tax=Plakobranchus ocellatus TaxID=259542 RepID=A0AAV4DSG8_9GAST|nr:hypothetical protein PoB_007343900 [Plakobranchus ocellatus]